MEHSWPHDVRPAEEDGKAEPSPNQESVSWCLWENAGCRCCCSLHYCSFALWQRPGEWYPKLQKCRNANCKRGWFLHFSDGEIITSAEFTLDCWDILESRRRSDAGIMTDERLQNSQQDNVNLPHKNKKMSEVIILPSLNPKRWRQ